MSNLISSATSVFIRRLLRHRVALFFFLNSAEPIITEVPKLSFPGKVLTPNPYQVGWVTIGSYKFFRILRPTLHSSQNQTSRSFSGPVLSANCFMPVPINLACESHRFAKGVFSGQLRTRPVLILPLADPATIIGSSFMV